MRVVSTSVHAPKSDSKVWRMGCCQWPGTGQDQRRIVMADRESFVDHTASQGCYLLGFLSLSQGLSFLVLLLLLLFFPGSLSVKLGPLLAT